MAQLSYNEVGGNTSSGDISYFKLDDGQEALVRIMIDSVDDFDMKSVHRVTVGNSPYPNREVNCIRNLDDPADACPLCAAGVKLVKRIYIKMLQYDEQTGQANPVVWDAPVAPYASDLKTYLNNYGPLSNMLCKISRHGTKLDTKYSISPNLSSQMYPESKYAKIPNAFDGFSVLGRMVLDKDVEEIKTFMMTGNFPMPQQQDNGAQVASTTPVNANPTPTAAAPVNPIPQTPEGIPNGFAQPYEAPAMDRPTRYY